MARNNVLLILKIKFLAISIPLFILNLLLLYFICFGNSNIFSLFNAKKNYDLFDAKYKLVEEENEDYKYIVDTLYNKKSNDQIDKYLKETMIYLKKNEHVLDISDLK